MHGLLSLADAAAHLGIHVTTLRGWVRSGRVPAYRVGQRFTRVDWNELLAAIAVSHPSAQAAEMPATRALPESAASGSPIGRSDEGEGARHG